MSCFIILYGSNDCCDVKRITIDSYINYLRNERKVKDTSIASNIRNLRPFFNFCMKLGYIEKFDITIPKYTEVPKYGYTDEELMLLLKKPNTKRCSFCEYRNWVVTNYFLATGNRLSTVINIAVEDVNLHDGTIILRHSKNRKGKIMNIPVSLIAILREYSKIRKGQGKESFFCTADGKYFSISGFQKAIKLYNQKRGVFKTSIHLYRNTYARNFIQDGGGEFALKYALGHSSLSMSEKYVSMYKMDKTKTLDEHCPLNKFISERIKI